MGMSMATTTRLRQGERRDVAVLFLDLKGFTSLAESLDFEAVHQIINRVMQTLSEIVTRSGGYVDKLEGDQIMALFGAKQASDNDSIRAVDCALRMLEAIEDVSRMLASLKIETGARVGICYGKVIVAPDASGHLTATGDVVNVASRLESEAAVGTIMASDKVRKECRELFLWTDLGRISLKGRTSPVHAWRPDGAGAERIERWERSARISGTPFFGRGKETGFLHDEWSLFQNEQSGTDPNIAKLHTVIEIQGEAGIGKSRIIHEFIHGLSTAGNPPLVLSGWTRSHSQPPLWLWTTLLNNASSQECYSPDKSGQHRSFFANMAEALEDTEIKKGLTASIPFLENLLSIESQQISLEEMDDESRRKETMVAIRKFLEAASSLDTIVVVLEDIHWIDKASAEVLEFILSGLSLRNPVFFLLLKRPSHEIDVTGGIIPTRVNYNILKLLPLQDEDSSLIIRNMLTSTVVPETENLILSRSRGNPFFIEEMVLDLIESGYLMESSEGWKLSVDLTFDLLPSSVTGLLRSRIDRLSRELKQALLRVSVLGSDFTGALYKIVCEILDENTETELIRLKELCRKGFLQHTEQQRGDSFSFHHVLIRDTAYNMLLIHNRMILHKCTAKAMEIDSSTADRGDMAVIIADHWNRAGNVDKAINWSRRALIYCERNFLTEEGLAVSENLIQWVSEQPGSSFRDNALFEAMLKKERFLNFLTRREEQEQLLNHLLIISADMNHKRWSTAVKERLGRMQVFTGKLEQARKTLETALKECEYGNNMELRGSLLADMSILCLKQGRKEESLINSMKALKIFRKTGNKSVECMVLNNIGSAYWSLDKNEQALKYYSTAEELSHITRNRWYQGNILGNMGIIYKNMGQFDLAREHYTNALALNRELGNRLAEAHVLVNLGILDSMTGNMNSTKRSYRNALEVYIEAGNTLGELQTLGKLGRLSVKQDDDTAAEVYFRKSLELQKQTGHTGDEAETLNSLAELLRKTDRLDEAQEKVKIALKLSKEIGYTDDELNSLYLLASIALDKGNEDEALDHYRKISKILENFECDSQFESCLNELERRMTP